MTITLKQYWLALQKSIEDFDSEFLAIKGKESTGDLTYRKQRNFLEELARLGIRVEEAVLMKPILALSLKGFPEKELGPEKLITDFAGPISLLFAERVYLSHLRRFEEVSIEDQDPVIKTFVNWSDQQAEVRQLAVKLEAAILQHKQKLSPLVATGLFASSLVSAAGKSQQEALATDAEYRL